ncbi:MAG: 16S rRNA (guanine(966)-N(2))-methyltransferase RsmD [Candidatus Nealsonbacteria bacterium]|nr:16S rRNA (guanine(966)-N(2))-methyltransferase RsmD [Candidatus Nealsonbacteria bacterium]
MTPPRQRKSSTSRPASKQGKPASKQGKPASKQGKQGKQAGKQHKPVGLRIIGGRFRGRKLAYGGDRRVRPMKDRVREAIFNLVGPAIRDKHAIDLFAGTGALGLEALSRGAKRVTLIEQHFPTAAIIRRNVATLDVEDISEVVTANVFLWQKTRGDLGPMPWVVFCSPPYEFYVSRIGDMLELITELLDSAPAGSIFVVESDDRFDAAVLPRAEAWDVRRYSPAVVAIYP